MGMPSYPPRELRRRPVVQSTVRTAETVIRPGMPPGASGGNAIRGAISRALGVSKSAACQGWSMGRGG